jgi:lauroyl/myristoyl acyltransferase
MKPYDLYLLTVIGLLKVADYCRLLGLKEFFARAVAFAAFHLSRRRRQFKEHCISRTLALSAPEIQKVVRRSFYYFWHDLFFSLSFSRNGKAQRITAEFRGQENLKEALAKGKGVILWESSSLGTRTLAKRILYEYGFLVSQIHSEVHLGGFYNPQSWISRHVIQPFFHRCEAPFVKEILSLSGSHSLKISRDLLGRLRQNEIICISAEGRIGYGFIPVTFLGRRDLFPTGVVSLARLSGATILPLFCLQGEANLPSLIVERPIQINPEGDRQCSAERSILQYLSLMESYIKSYPEQYRNWHAGERRV